MEQNQNKEPQPQLNASINLTFEQIYSIMCDKCRDEFLQLAASEGVKQIQESTKQGLLDGLKAQLSREE